MSKRFGTLVAAIALMAAAGTGVGSTMPPSPVPCVNSTLSKCSRTMPPQPVRRPAPGRKG